MPSTDSSTQSAGSLPVGISDFGKLIRGNHTFIDNSLLKKLMAQADARFKQKMEQLIQNHSVEEQIDPNLVFGDLSKSTIALWSLLLFSGYLTASVPRYDRRGRVKCVL